MVIGINQFIKKAGGIYVDKQSHKSTGDNNVGHPSHGLIGNNEVGKLFTRIENHDAPGHKLREKDGLLKNRDIDQPVYISHKSYYVRQTSDISTSDGFLDKLGHKKTNGNHELLGNGRPNVDEQYLKSKDYSRYY